MEINIKETKQRSYTLISICDNTLHSIEYHYIYIVYKMLVCVYNDAFPYRKKACKEENKDNFL